MSHAAPEGEASATMSPRLARIVAWSGVVVCLLAAAVYVGLVIITLTDVATTNDLTERIPNRGGRYSGRDTTGLAVFAGGALVFLMVGAMSIGLADLARRRAGESTLTPYTSRKSRGGYAYPVRPIGIGWHIGWIVLLAVAFFLIDPVQRAIGVLSADADPAIALEVLLFLPGIMFSGLAGATATSLVKKLSYPGQVRRHPERALDPRPGMARTWLYRYRFDLVVGAVAGVLFGAIFSTAAAGHPGAAVVFLVLSVIVGGLAALLSLQFWRTGEPLMVTTISRTPGNVNLIN